MVTEVTHSHASICSSEGPLMGPSPPEFCCASLHAGTSDPLHFLIKHHISSLHLVPSQAAHSLKLTFLRLIFHLDSTILISAQDWRREKLLSGFISQLWSHRKLRPALDFKLCYVGISYPPLHTTAAGITYMWNSLYVPMKLPFLLLLALKWGTQAFPPCLLRNRMGISYKLIQSIPLPKSSHFQTLTLFYNSLVRVRFSTNVMTIYSAIPKWCWSQDSDFDNWNVITSWCLKSSILTPCCATSYIMRNQLTPMTKSNETIWLRI